MDREAAQKVRNRPRSGQKQGTDREAAQKGRWPRSGQKQGIGREAAQKVFGVVGAKRRPPQISQK
jgi:hypothetical protein